MDEGRRGGVTVLEELPEEDVTITDGSRYQRLTAAGAITTYEFLGEYATVMDAELLAISMGWKLSKTVATNG